ncbi:MAG: hypothetical protein ABEH66_02670 [Halobacteriales archaeon]
MSGHTPDAPPPVENDAGENVPEKRYAAFAMETGEFVVYDTENSRAWLQTSAPADLDAMA